MLYVILLVVLADLAVNVYHLLIGRELHERPFIQMHPTTQQPASVAAGAIAVDRQDIRILLCDAKGAIEHEQTVHRGSIPHQMAYSGKSYALRRQSAEKDHIVAEYRRA